MKQRSLEVGGWDNALSQTGHHQQSQNMRGSVKEKEAREEHMGLAHAEVTGHLRESFRGVGGGRGCEAGVGEGSG